ncbi:WG repeat-containing protein [Cohnella yongneupensis]|uniref:WG repeat-containing protein n=1 Tax=Cohnella yongneupensis TaxID=425006 RepID=A0ABW0QVH9_9BACL
MRLTMAFITVKSDHLGAKKMSYLFPIQTGRSSFGYINVHGQVVIESKFKNAREFSEGLAYVESNFRGEKGFIGLDGKLKFTIENISICQIDADPFRDGLAMITETDDFYHQSYFVDTMGKKPFEVDFNSVEPFSEGLARITHRDYSSLQSTIRSGYIDTRGKVIIQPKFDDARDFSRGMAGAMVDGKWGLINKSGDWVEKPTFDDVRSHCEGLAAVKSKGKWGYYRKADGSLAINPQFDFAGDFSDGLAYVVHDDKPAYIDKSGQIAFTTPHNDFMVKNHSDYYTRFSEGAAGVRVEGMWGFIDKRGSFITRPQFTSISPFKNGLASVYYDENDWTRIYSYIDLTGKVVWSSTVDFTPSEYSYY